MPGDFRPILYEEEKSQIEEQQQQSIEIIPSSPRPFYQNQAIQQMEPPNFVTYLQPKNYAQIPKTLKLQGTPRPIVHVSSSPATGFSPSTVAAPNLVLFKSAVTPSTNRPQYSAYQIEDGRENYSVAPQQQEQEQRNHYQSNYPNQYDDTQYTLDPDDGYDGKVLQNGKIIPRYGHSHKHKYSSSYSTTPVPHTTATPFYQYHTQSVRPHHQPLQYHEERHHQQTAEPFQPTIPTEQTPSTRQHLTETTQIQPPTLTTYRPSIAPPTPTPTHHYVPTYQKNDQAAHPYVIAPQIQPKQQQQQLPQIIVRDPEPQSYVTPTPTPTRPYLSPSTITEILRRLQRTNLLPQELNDDNIDHSIKTLVAILSNLKNSKHVTEVSPPPPPPSSSQHISENEVVYRPQQADASAEYEDGPADDYNEAEPPQGKKNTERSFNINHIKF